MEENRGIPGCFGFLVGIVLLCLVIGFFFNQSDKKWGASLTPEDRVHIQKIESDLFKLGDAGTIIITRNEDIRMIWRKYRDGDTLKIKNQFSEPAYEISVDEHYLWSIKEIIPFTDPRWVNLVKKHMMGIQD